MHVPVSVIIPVFNAEQTIERCVESLLFGVKQNIEIILIEDCSSDHSWEQCQNLSEKYQNVHCYRNSRNAGVSFSRNVGMEKAVGQFLLFVDSDDWASRQYSELLWKSAEKHPKALVACGFHFIDRMERLRQAYLWEANGKEHYHVMAKDFFDLLDRSHLQQVWNKVFRRDIVEQYHIRFDEKLNMGEDCQFVLDYIKAAQIQECIVINRPLYYYIRASRSSLMSGFGLTNNESALQQLEQLQLLCGDTEEIQRRFEQEKEKLRQNYMYQIAHSTWTKKEKIDAIERIAQDGRSKKYLNIQQRLILKECIYKKKHEIAQVPGRIQGKLSRHQQSKEIERMKEKLQNERFTIIAQNCIGGVLYHDMGLQFQTPTVNLFLKGPDFVRFVQNLRYYMDCELLMTWGEEYPIGYLDDVAIYFMHYDSCSQARKAWEKRKERIHWDRIIVFCTDMEDFTDEVYEAWKTIPYPKVLFSATERDDADTIYFPQYREQGKVSDLIPKREFYRNGTVIQKLNQLARRDS